MKGKLVRATRRNHVFQRKALVLAIGSIISGFTGAAWAQATNGTIYGAVPVAPGETIQITGGAGFNRTSAVGPSGKYSITLPVGTYTVSLLQNGKVVQTRTNVSPVAAGAVAVDFSNTVSAANATTLSAVTVTANQIAPIDVTTTNQVTTITAKQLQELPLQRGAEDIAMLAPGVNMGSSAFSGGPLGTSVVSFGGASIAENAYYIDGMNTTDQLQSVGGISLPYGAIEQQQTFISGYGAKYGRSIGGVINQIGKSGSNEWHFGARALWQPASWQNSPVNYYWANPLYTQPGEQLGQLEAYRRGEKGMETIYDAYVSGPIIKDKLFFFLGAEQDNQSGTSIGATDNPFTTSYETHNPKLYGKLNWNINSNNILTLTGLQNSHKTWDSNYFFNYNTLKTGDFASLSPTYKTAFRVAVANYTSYITDNLTLNAMFGKMRGEYYNEQSAYPGFNPALPNIGSPSLQNPAFVPPGGVVNSQSNVTQGDPNHKASITNYRLSLDYKWQDHDFQVGIDNINTQDLNDGVTPTGPGYAWFYGQGDLNKPLTGSDPNVAPYVGPPNANAAGSGGYYVEKHVYLNVASVRIHQRAEYVEDNWNVTPNLLLNLGLRNDQFINDNSEGVPYIRETKPQWAPRLGFSWDVHGDSTLKVFGNAGRYYLALPAELALAVSAPLVTTNQYGTYTGVDPATGAPIGFEPLPQNPATGVSIDNLYGEAKDPRLAAAQNIKAEYSDNFVAGLQQQFQMLGTQWVAGATGTFQVMSRVIDDYDDIQAECAAGVAQGLTYMTPDTCGQWTQSLLLINPGETNDILVLGPDGKLHPIALTAKDQGFQRGPTRRYYSLDLSLAHAWDGKWFAKFDYVYARGYGNDEGPVQRSTFSGGSYADHSSMWDFPQLMEFSNGLLPTDVKHQFKLYGAYAINPEWKVGGNLYVSSGVPQICTGHYGPDQTDPLGYGSDYHWCGGKPAPPGSNGFLPWTYNLDLSVDYKPAWAGHKLDFNLAVFNVFNKQTPTLLDNFYGTTENPNNDYLRVESSQSPRMMRFSVAYDF